MDTVFILGPCSMEDEHMYLSIAHTLTVSLHGVNWIYKASFDKANRTSIKGKRGVQDVDRALELLKEVKRACPNIKLTTDVHESWQPSYFAGLIDVIQIPAFLCRQTDLVVECARHFNIINIKKMQHLGPNNMNKSIDKIKNTNPNAQAWLTDRGTSLGYDHLIVDFAMVKFYKQVYDKVILDATHSTQRSRTVYGKQGDRELSKRYFLSAQLFGYDGVFAEVHPDPDNAVSDGDCQIQLYQIPNLMHQYEKISSALSESK